MVTELEISDVSIDVVFKDIKNVHLSVYPPTGRVRVTAPANMKLETVRLFALSKIAWIRKNQSKIRAQERETPREYIERESHFLWGRRFLLQIKDEADQTGVMVGHKFIELNVPGESNFEQKRDLLWSYYREELRKASRPIIAQFEKELNVRVEKLLIQKMKTKWGSSSPGKNLIRLNLDLVRFDKDCLKYVILHEMAHFLVPNHNLHFKELLDRYMPGWEAIRSKLNYGPLLEYY